MLKALLAFARSFYPLLHGYVGFFWTVRQRICPRSSSKYCGILGVRQKDSLGHGPHCYENIWYLFQSAIFTYIFPVNTLLANVFKVAISINFSFFLPLVVYWSRFNYHRNTETLQKFYNYIFSICFKINQIFWQFWHTDIWNATVSTELRNEYMSTMPYTLCGLRIHFKQILIIKCDFFFPCS